jgi:predicted phosphodiesterase
MISDLHGNTYALEKTLEDIKKRSVDQIICLGDVATLGPDPMGVMDLLKTINCPNIMGNHDEFMIYPESLKYYKTAPFIIDSVEATRISLSNPYVEFINSFQKNLEYKISDTQSVLFYHGSPDSNTQNILPNTSEKELEEAYGKYKFNVFVGGHTHVQMMVPFKGSMIVNTGSVGLPFEEFVDGKEPVILETAEYATVAFDEYGTHIEFHHVPLKRSILKESIIHWDNPLRPHRLKQYS